MTEDEIRAIKGHADAALKLSMLALEFMQNLAVSQGKSLDFVSASQAMLNSPSVDGVSKEVFLIEKIGRETAAEMLMVLARGFNQA